MKKIGFTFQYNGGVTPEPDLEPEEEEDEETLTEHAYIKI